MKNMKRRKLLLAFLPLLGCTLSSCGVIDFIKENTPLGDEYKEEQFGYRLSTYNKDYVIGETYTFYYYKMENDEKCKGIIICLW